MALTEAKLRQLFADLVATSHLTRSKAFLVLKTLTPPGSEGLLWNSEGTWEMMMIVSDIAGPVTSL